MRTITIKTNTAKAPKHIHALVNVDIKITCTKQNALIFFRMIAIFELNFLLCKGVGVPFSFCALQRSGKVCHKNEKNYNTHNSDFIFINIGVIISMSERQKIRSSICFIMLLETTEYTADENNHNKNKYSQSS